MAYKNVVTMLAVNLFMCCFCTLFLAEAMRANHHFRSDSAFTRLKRMEASIKAQSTGRLETLVGMGVPVVGEDRAYFMTIGMGTPPINIRSQVDTSSDLIWFDCTALPAGSSTFKSVPCPSSFCSDLPNSTCSTNCQFSHNYTGGRNISGELFSETFTMTNGSGAVHSFGGVAFGCSHDTQGQSEVGANGVVWNNGLVGRNGVVGLGRGKLSLISQIGESKFSYCLADDYAEDYDDITYTPLLFGSAEELSGTGVQSTMMIKNSARPELNNYYYLSMEGISVGNISVNIPQGTFDIQANGSGGFIIDSATPYTVLPHGAFTAVASVLDSLFDSASGFRRINNSRDGFSLCYQSPYALAPYLNMTFHMGRGADFVIEGRQNFITYTDVDPSVVCLAVLDMGDASVEGVPAVLGNFQQQNYHILYDNGNETLSFVTTNCRRLVNGPSLYPEYSQSKALTLGCHGLSLALDSTNLLCLRIPTTPTTAFTPSFRALF
ncbi:aspartic proteinase nepenthesin-2-like [Cryptomeria japonica]|uniref:aspartic proteinase nepenthesin-2-like n=1 Tax=Cryptomeria japonica TaxID=3369 RepID=UPI0027D9F958|nr:aspartic proteinase nepenthesin-2-like [Cryptomeria japonica]XP_059071108.1 aspartic proteinase nepenthesin-2-like [Cryptomeria japonica]XP_059071269.1 aspartic proteinase nepenthesin-2-like [Cryptomeria japonica]XP_059071715.1 aspartic proteinase nepenthesin-2-like [Cryptomeria japonica]